MNETLKKKQPFPRWRCILLGLVLTAMLLLSVLMLASYVVGKQLGAEVVKVSRSGEPLTFADLEAGLSQSSTSGDAGRYYVQALMNVHPDALESLKRVNKFYRKNIISLPANQFPGDLREKVAQSLVRFQPVLEKFDKGAVTSLPGFDIGIQHGKQACLTILRHVQVASFLLSLRTLNLIMQDEDDAAANSAISMLKMTRIFDFHPTMALHAAKLNSVGLVCEDVRLLLEHGDPSEKALAKLEKALRKIIPENTLERMFLTERVYQLEVGRNLIPEKITSRFLQDKIPDLPERIRAPRSHWTWFRIRREALRYLRDMAQLITVARQPWPGPLDAISIYRARGTSSSSKLISSGTGLIRLTAETLAFVRCTILAIGIERYHRLHGELPGSLDEVSADHIKSIPLDPFTGKKLLYSCDEESCVIYSAGINRRDDNGSITRGAYQKIALDSGFRIRFGKSK